MNITNLLKISYWTDLRPRYFGETTFYLVLGVLIASLLAAIVIFFLKRKGGAYKKTLSQIYSLLIANFIVGSLLLFFRFELVPFLSARFWTGLWIISLLIWIYFIIKEAKKIPAKIQALKLEQEKKKYIP